MLTDSKLNMWRTVFAMAHVDGTVKPQERDLMESILKEEEFSSEQESVLRGDIETSQDAVGMFRKISDAADQSAFFDFASKMVWVDGVFCQEEQDEMIKIHRRHVYKADIENMVGSVDLELEDGGEVLKTGPVQDVSKKDMASMNSEKMLHLFRDAFVEKKE